MNIKLVPHWSLLHLIPYELAPYNKSETHKQAEFHVAIWGKLGESMTLPPKLAQEEKPQTLSFVPDDDEKQGSYFPPKEDLIYPTGKPVN